VVDAKGMSRSAGAILLGYEKFDPDLKLGGALFNRIGSDHHLDLLKETAAGQVAVVGGLFRDEALALPERHLGLTQAEEVLSNAFVDRLVQSIEKGVDLDLLLQIASTAVERRGPEMPTLTQKNKDKKVRIGVARDDAFSFYYQDNLDLLEESGAELVYFSPMRDHALPPSLQVLYLGGGYPELYAKALSENISLMKEIRARAESGLPIYAECGGLIYLTEGVLDAAGSFFPLIGLFPTRARMLQKRKALGYVEVALKADCLLGKAGQRGRGHEFHYSELTDPLEGRPGIGSVYEAKARRGSGAPSGYQYKNTLASYVHLHFHSNPAWAQGLLAS
jgi:cobyrinic acid a,c-diamide synthase